jgi:hypothetical protein
MVLPEPEEYDGEAPEQHNRPDTERAWTIERTTTATRDAHGNLDQVEVEVTRFFQNYYLDSETGEREAKGDKSRKHSATWVFNVDDTGRASLHFVKNISQGGLKNTDTTYGERPERAEEYEGVFTLRFFDTYQPAVDAVRDLPGIDVVVQPMDDALGAFLDAGTDYEIAD